MADSQAKTNKNARILNRFQASTCVACAQTPPDNGRSARAMGLTGSIIIRAMGWIVTYSSGLLYNNLVSMRVFLLVAIDDF